MSFEAKKKKGPHGGPDLKSFFYGFAAHRQDRLRKLLFLGSAE
jgi:hypothetical protein